MRYAFQMPAAADGVATWEGDFHVRAERLVVRTLDTSGQPVAARVRVEMAGETIVDARARSGDGVAVFDDLLPGKYGLVVEFEDGGQASQDVTLPSEGVEVRRPAAGEVLVRVLDESGSGMVNQTVYAFTWIGEGAAPFDDQDLLEASGSASAQTDENGVAALRGVRAGTVLVRLRSMPITNEQAARARRIELADRGRVETSLRFTGYPAMRGR